MSDLHRTRNQQRNLYQHHMNALGRILALALTTTAGAVWGQVSPPAIQQFDQNRRIQEQQKMMTLEPGGAVPELYPGENEDVGPQRILQVKPRRKYLEAGADSQYFYTSNVLLTKHATDSALFINTAHVALAPDPYEVNGGYLSPRLGFRNQWYNYGLDGSRNSWGAFDFASQTLAGELSYRFLQHWSVRGSLDATRLLTQPSYKEFYKELAPGWGLQRLIPITDRQVISLAYLGYYHVSETTGPVASNANDRYDHILAVSYGLEIVPRLVFQPFYHYQFTGYTGNLGGHSRTDTIQSVGASLSYWFNKWSGIRTFVNFDHSESDDPFVPSYNKLDVGGGLSLLVRF